MVLGFGDLGRIRIVTDLLSDVDYAASPLVTVFAGSSGLSAFMEFHGMQDQFADLMPVDMPPICAAEARLPKMGRIFVCEFREVTFKAWSIKNAVGKEEVGQRPCFQLRGGRYEHLGAQPGFP
ncbi:MAG: hypothetical protein P4L55_12730 [Syntrophobacteraceae bacterium]|nr:hypothetical protein [Syntrophobacteraceae bacterium]